MCQSLVKIVNQMMNNALNNVDEIGTIIHVSFHHVAFSNFLN